jgi:hypothetical protein
MLKLSRIHITIGHDQVRIPKSLCSNMGILSQIVVLCVHVQILQGKRGHTRASKYITPRLAESRHKLRYAKILVRKPEDKRLLGKPVRRWEDNITRFERCCV